MNKYINEILIKKKTNPSLEHLIFIIIIINVTFTQDINVFIDRLKFINNDLNLTYYIVIKLSTIKKTVLPV